MVIWLPLLVAIVGLIIYAFATNAKAQTLARDAFWVGLLAFLLEFGGRVAVR